MSTRHVARAGESIESIAYRYGMFWETVWDAADNAELREQREPNILVPGDVVVVPDKHPKVESCAVDRRHVFRRRGVPSVLRVQLRDGGQPRAHLAYTVEANGLVRTGTTDAEGWVECWLMPNVRGGELRLDATGETFRFVMGTVGPAEHPEGVQTRLRNLGFYDGPIEAELGPAAAAALAAFQRANDLPDTGEPDADTIAALQRAHGS